MRKLKRNLCSTKFFIGQQDVSAPIGPSSVSLDYAKIPPLVHFDAEINLYLIKRGQL